VKHGSITTRLGDWGEVVGGRQRSPHLTRGRLRPYLRVANVLDDHIDTTDVFCMLFEEHEFERFRLRHGDILLNEGQSLELVGRSAIYLGDPPDCAFQNSLVRFRAGPTCDFRFAQQLFKRLCRQGVFQRIAKKTTTMAHLGVTRFADLVVTVPSLSEQGQIADLMDRFDRLRTTLTRLIDTKRRFKRGVMQQLLSAKMRFPEFRDRKWQVLTLGEFVRYTPRKVNKPTGTFLSAGVRSHGKGVFLKKEFQSDGIALDELFELKHRDLVVNITFGWEGAVAIVPTQADGALVSHRFPTFVADETKVLVEYLRHLIGSKRFVFDVGVASPGGAGRNRVLNRREFLDIALSIPPIDEQRKIAEVLNTCDREIDLLTKQREQIEVYKRGLLAKLLSGHIAIPS
jgi:type I restriction enzyme, S subunit